MREDIARLIENLAEAQRLLAEATGGQVDAVLLSSAGPVLLPAAQEDLLRREAEQRQFAEEKDAILDALPLLVALLDPSGRIVTVNKAWRSFAVDESFCGKRLAVGHNYMAEIARAEGVRASQATTIADGVLSVVAKAAGTFALEYSCHAAGQRHWFQIRVSPMPRTSGYGAVVMQLDITERKRAEAHTQEIHQQLQTLVGEANVGILVHRDFQPLLANGELARMLGYRDKDEILALPSCRTLFAPEEQVRIDGFNRARQSGRPAPGSYSVKGRKRDGTTIAMENRAFGISWGDKPAIVAMMTDVTEQRSTEAQLRRAQRLEAVGQLTGGMAHDFNNLLQVILGGTEYLEENLAHNEEMRVMAEMARKAAERGAELTQRMLAFARLQPLAPEAIEVDRLISGMDGLLRRTLGENLEIVVIGGRALRRGLADAAQLEGAVLNLCINARDAMPEGGRLTIETANVQLGREDVQSDEVAPGPYVMVAVTDSGTGMDAETLARAFEPFFTTKEVGKGSGLGLSMIYGFVRQSKGHVQILSQPGLGTTVRMYFPVADRGADVETAKVVDASVPRGREKILVVEDNAAVRDLVSSQLVGLGYDVIVVDNAAEALQALRQTGDVDLLFTDVMMPGGMNGRELAEQAQALRPGLPVLFTSGYTHDMAIHDGRSRLLAKPYRRQQLATTIRDVLSGRSD